MINVYFHIRNQYYHTLIAFRRPIQMKRKRGDQFVWPDFHNILTGSHLWRPVPDLGRRARSNIRLFLWGVGQQAQSPELHHHPGMQKKLTERGGTPPLRTIPVTRVFESFPNWNGDELTFTPDIAHLLLRPQPQVRDFKSWSHGSIILAARKRVGWGGVG